MQVPKTSVDKNHFFSLTEDYIGGPRQVAAMEPIAEMDTSDCTGGTDQREIHRQ